MKLTTSKCKITGVHFGEAELNLIRGDRPALKVKYALVGEDGTTCGFFEKAGGWSEKALEALRVFTEALEEDCMPALFDKPTEPSSEEKPAEPQQF